MKRFVGVLIGLLVSVSGFAAEVPEKLEIIATYEDAPSNKFTEKERTVDGAKLYTFSAKVRLKTKETKPDLGVVKVFLNNAETMEIMEPPGLKDFPKADRNNFKRSAEMYFSHATGPISSISLQAYETDVDEKGRNSLATAKVYQALKDKKPVTIKFTGANSSLNELVKEVILKIE
jgi:hypothetical protein